MVGLRMGVRIISNRFVNLIDTKNQYCLIASNNVDSYFVGFFYNPYARSGLKKDAEGMKGL